MSHHPSGLMVLKVVALLCTPQCQPVESSNPVSLTHFLKLFLQNNVIILIPATISVHMGSRQL